MQEKELISITVDEDNKKYKNIVRTKKAYKIKDAMAKYRDYTESVLSNGFSDEELNTLSEMLERVYNNLISDIYISDEEKIKLERRHNLK